MLDFDANGFSLLGLCVYGRLRAMRPERSRRSRRQSNVNRVTSAVQLDLLDPWTGRPAYGRKTGTNASSSLRYILFSFLWEKVKEVKEATLTPATSSS